MGVLLASSLSWVPIAYASVSFLVPCGYPFRFSSSFAPFCDTGSGELVLRRSSSAGSSLVLVACRPWGGQRVRMVRYHHGLFSPLGRAVWIMWMERLLAVLVVYLYCQLVVYIV